MRTQALSQDHKKLLALEAFTFDLGDLALVRWGWSDSRLGS